MFGVDEAKNLLEKYKDRPILVYGDPDADGLFAMLIVCQYLEMKGLTYSYYVNDNRQHGFFLSPEKIKGYLVIAVDFDLIEELDDVVSNEAVVICFDHHDICEEQVLRYKDGELRAVVVNNQYPFEPADNRYLSGAGVTYEALCTISPEFKSKEREALVGITLLSDICPIENDKARGYLKTTYSSDTTKGYAGYIVSSTSKADFSFGVPKLDRSFIDYTFSPTVNSLLRFGYTTSAVKFILGSGLDVTTTRERQSQLVQIMKQRAQFLEMKNYVAVALDENAFTDVPDVNLANFIGLLASDIKGLGRSVLAFTHRDGVVTRASFRGKYDGVLYRDAFVQLGLDAQGHPPAFGILNFKPYNELWQIIDDTISKLEDGFSPSIQIVDVNNLSFFLMNKGYNLATENCYVRDMFRTYIRYTGKGAKIIRTTYKTEPFTYEDQKSGLKPDKVIGGKKLKYVKDVNGQPVPKYIEYIIDGTMVKSFGIAIEDGLILPILERSAVQLYVRDKIN